MAITNKRLSVRKNCISFVCPLCQHKQNTNIPRTVSLKNHAQFFIATAALTWVCWPIFGGKGAVFYLLLWAAFEFVVRARKRQALICQSCGFDPFLYKQDIGRARQALRQHWEARIANENLFVGKKLKNYQTSGVNAEEKASIVPPSTDANGLGVGAERLT